MNKIAILGPLKQQAESLKTQFNNIFVLFNDQSYIRNKYEMITSDRIIYKAYSAHSLRQEIKHLHKLLKEISPDVIYANGFAQLWMVGLLIREPGLLPRRPITLVTSRNSWAWQNSSKRFAIALSCHLIPDGIFTLANFQENWLRKFGVSYSKIRTIPNAVDVEQFTPVGLTDYFAEIFSENENYPVIVNVANISKLKGQDVLIKCINEVKKKENNVRLVLIGKQYPGSKYDRFLKSLIAKYHLENNVYILGNIDHRKVPMVLRSAHISAISSWNEVCPNVLLESLSVGKVTISSRVGGIPDIIRNGANGFLINPGDIKGFADCILDVANNPSLKMSIEKEARISAIANFSYDVIGREHKNFLTSLIGSKKYSGLNHTIS